MATDTLQLEEDHLGQDQLVRAKNMLSPFTLIGWRLLKIRAEECTVLLLTPYWRIQPWYPALLELLVDFSILLPKHRN